jgi:hypothetical protein
MKKTLLLFVAFLGVLQFTHAQNEERRDRVMSSYLVAFGILPQDNETNYWLNDPVSAKTVTDLVNEHKKNIANNQSLADRAILNSYQDAFGRAPRTDEYVTWRPLRLSYIELMERHMKYLRDYPLEFEEVIKRSYSKQFNRPAQSQEMKNWKS